MPTASPLEKRTTADHDYQPVTTVLMLSLVKPRPARPAQQQRPIRSCVNVFHCLRPTNPHRNHRAAQHTAAAARRRTEASSARYGLASTTSDPPPKTLLAAHQSAPQSRRNSKHHCRAPTNRSKQCPTRQIKQPTTSHHTYRRRTTPAPINPTSTITNDAGSGTVSSVIAKSAS
jgi:hypothetical protein